MNGSHEKSEPVVNRRRLLAGAGLASAAVAGGAVGGGVVAAASDGGGLRRESLSLDVACMGDTWRDSPVRNPADQGDFRGVPFSIEGWIYPEGTIPGDGFVPTSEGAIGHWFCRGTVIIHSQRPEPHVTSTQEHILGRISPDHLFPPDTLTCTGLEGTFVTQLAALRPVIGGTGRYMGAVGQVRQVPNGVNTSIFDDGTDDPAPNFRFEFDLFLPA